MISNLQISFLVGYISAKVEEIKDSKNKFLIDGQNQCNDNN